MKMKKGTMGLATCLPLDTATDGDLQSIDASSAALTSAIIIRF